MTTANPLDDAPSRAGRRPSAIRHWYAVVRDALDRPLTAYYLLLGASALLLTIGLIMVLSASSVYSYEQNDGNSYAVVTRQLIWVAIGDPVRLDRLRGCRSAPCAGSPGRPCWSRSCCSPWCGSPASASRSTATRTGSAWARS